MLMCPKVFSLEFSQVEVDNLEGEFFSCMSNYKGKLGSEGVNLFKEDYPLLYELYKLLGETTYNCR